MWSQSRENLYHKNLTYFKGKVGAIELVNIKHLRPIGFDKWSILCVRW